ncbi:MAG: hypothetical protein IJL92_02385 [Thermoguttaceae bacterium]|nr:hypothetical protein [Thermoguttaceae bacterium]
MKCERTPIRTEANNRRFASRRLRGTPTLVASCLTFTLCVLTLLGGCCAAGGTRGGGATAVGAFEPEQPNPLFVETQDNEALWDAIVDVIDNYYVIETEIPVRAFERQDSNGQTYVYRTEGRLETKPSIMGGVQEPWRKNGAPQCCDRWFATFQTVRSSAVVRVVPEGKGFFIYLSVFDEIEDMPKPMGSSVSYNLKFREDVSQLSQPVGERAKSKGWIPVGRDDELETYIMKELAWRVGAPRAVLHAGVDSDLVP